MVKDFVKDTVLAGVPIFAHLPSLASGIELVSLRIKYAAPLPSSVPVALTDMVPEETYFLRS